MLLLITATTWTWLLTTVSIICIAFCYQNWFHTIIVYAVTISITFVWIDTCLRCCCYHFYSTVAASSGSSSECSRMSAKMNETVLWKLLRTFWNVLKRFKQRFKIILKRSKSFVGYISYSSGFSSIKLEMESSKNWHVHVQQTLKST